MTACAPPAAAFAAGDLAVIIPFSNSSRWKSRLANFRRVEDILIGHGVALFTGELAYGDRPFELEDRPGVTRLRFRTGDILWHKENICRIVAQNVPPRFKHLCFHDGDTWMADPRWPIETIEALQIHQVAQVSSHLVFLGPRGEHVSIGTSLSWLHHKNGWFREPEACTSGPWGYPGFAWAFRRSTYDALGGLLDICILGSGDYHMARAMLGLPEPKGRVYGTAAAYCRHIDRWRERAAKIVDGDVAVVPGTALHFWHGSYKSRGYETRPSILVRHQFDPDADLVRDGQGIFRLAGNKPRFRDEMRAYAASRNEDSTDI